MSKQHKGNAAPPEPTLKDRAEDVYEAARERFSAATSAAGEVASTTIDTKPALAIAGGLALGAIAGALLPRTAKEDQLLGDTGARVNTAAKAALAAAREAGEAKLGEIGMSRDGVKEQAQKLFSQVGEVATAAAGAAAKAAREAR